MKRRRFVSLSILLLFIVIALYPSQKNSSIEYLDRASGEVRIEKVAGEKWLIWLYNNPLGKLSLEALVKRKFLSDYYGKRMDAPESAKKIESFVTDYGVDLQEAQKQSFTSFNDFFIRKLKSDVREIDPDTNTLVSPADGKIFAYQEAQKQDFIVKGYQFDIKEFLQSDSLAKKYCGGSIILIRLCPTDYHRFHFPVDGKVSQVTKIDGDYYSVSPIALKKRIEIFCQNKREFITISTDRFGDVIMAEIGATMVGSIIQTYKGDEVLKGQEKGYFKFGGSSVLLFFEKGKLQIDQDLLKNTRNNLETKVNMGERIGIRNDE